MRHLFEPHLVNDVFGDPGLYVDFNDEKRALLFDLGAIGALPPRKARGSVARDRLAALGVTTGPWLRQLKLAVLSGAPEETQIRVQWRDKLGEHEMTRSVGELAPVLIDVTPGRRIGYATDLRFTEANRRALVELLAGVDQLFIESVFLDADSEHAQRKNHLTAREAGVIAREVGAKAVVPFHFSPRYRGREAEVEAEVLAAWSVG